MDRVNFSSINRKTINFFESLDTNFINTKYCSWHYLIWIWTYISRIQTKFNV